MKIIHPIMLALRGWRIPLSKYNQENPIKQRYKLTQNKNSLVGLKGRLRLPNHSFPGHSEEAPGPTKAS